MTSPRVVFVTSPDVPIEDVCRIARIGVTGLPPGAFAVQLRDKDASAPALAALVAALSFAPVIVNGRDLATSLQAAKAGAMGVHVDGRGLGAGDVARARAALGPDALVSAATHDDHDVAHAAREGASLVLVSPIFATPGAEKAAPRGTGALRSACRVLEEAGTRGRVAVVALGGVTPASAGACNEAGADGVAAIRAFLDVAERELRGVVLALAAPFVDRAPER